MDGGKQVEGQETTANTSTKVAQVRGLLTLLGSGVVMAVVIVGLLVYYYGPSGRYVVSSVLLSPTVLSELSYPDSQTSGARARMVFHSIQLHSYDEQRRQWRQKKVDVLAYADLYKAISSDRSLSPEDPAAADAFFRGPALRVAILVAPASGDGQPSTFQELHVAPNGNYFRIELHQQDPQQRWAYFRHDGIGELLNKTIGNGS